MSEPYRQCAECGHRALRFATRCPGCAIALPDPEPFEPDADHGLSWSKPFIAVMAVLAIGLAIVSLESSSKGPPPLNAESPWVQPVAIETAEAGALAPAADAGGALLIARGTTHVWRRRTVNARLEAVLMPGDTVTADSLAGGWYRVALYGEVLGYAQQAMFQEAHR